MLYGKYNLTNYRKLTNLIMNENRQYSRCPGQDVKSCNSRAESSKDNVVKNISRKYTPSDVLLTSASCFLKPSIIKIDEPGVLHIACDVIFSRTKPVISYKLTKRIYSNFTKI